MPKRARTSSAEASDDLSDVKALFPFHKCMARGLSTDTDPLPCPDVSDEETYQDERRSRGEARDWFHEAIASASTAQSVKLDVKKSGKLSIRVDLNALAKTHVKTAQKGKLIEKNKNEPVANDMFFKLPYEIRLKVYRRVFRTEHPIGFSDRKDFERTAALLRTNKAIYEEGIEVLYGENAFHFRRATDRRGPFWDAQWEDIGYKDVRRFLEMIGRRGIAKLRFVSFCFEDATFTRRSPGGNEMRRYVNDPVLYYIFELLGKNVILNRFAVTFAGRGIVNKIDVYFLRALAQVQCRQLIHVPQLAAQSSKIRADIFDTLQRVMELWAEDGYESLDKVNGQKVCMWHERYELAQPVTALW